MPTKAYWHRRIPKLGLQSQSDFKSRTGDVDQELKDVIGSIKSKFPDLPNKMVWGNYLIFEEYFDFFTMDIDYNDIDTLKREILDIALPKGFVVLIGKENKIYRND